MKKSPESPAPWLRSALSKNDFFSLGPELALEAASALYRHRQEKTISFSTKLSALYDLWLAQRRSKDPESLHKSEETIILMGKIMRQLYFSKVQEQLAAAPQQAGRRSPAVVRSLHEAPKEDKPLSHLHQRLAMLGITDKKTIEKLERSVGAGTLELRAGVLLKTFRGIEDTAAVVVPSNMRLFTESGKDFHEEVSFFSTVRRHVAHQMENAKRHGLNPPNDWKRDPEPYLDRKFLHHQYEKQKNEVLPWLMK